MLTQWDKIKAVERMQDHIEAHLTDKITMTALARAGRYSPWHAARLFKEVTGKAPFEYIRLRRLSEAAARLRLAPCKVVDVAFDFVFDSHEGFTRAFARQFGMSPDHFKKSRPAVFAPRGIGATSKVGRCGKSRSPQPMASTSWAIGLITLRPSKS